jgi:hypothetical protein
MFFLIKFSSKLSFFLTYRIQFSSHLHTAKNWGFYHGFAGYKELKSYKLNLKSPKREFQSHVSVIIKEFTVYIVNNFTKEKKIFFILL